MQLGFIFNEFLQGARRNVTMMVSVVLVTLVSLLFVGSAMLFQKQIDSMKDYWYDKVEVSIFLCTKDSVAATCPVGQATQEQRQLIEAQLSSAPLDRYVQSYEFESQSDAFSRFREQYKDSAIIDSVTQDQLPESFRVKLNDPTQYQVIADSFNGVMGVEQVVDQREILRKLFTILNGLTIGSLVLAAVMVAAAVLLVATTIRLSAYNRRREVGIMRLVGASTFVVQAPFVLEAVFAALIGASLAILGLWAALSFGVERLLGQKVANLVGNSELIGVSLILIVIAIALAGVSSLFALGKYLKV